MSGHPALRRALFRGAVWSVVPTLALGALSLLLGLGLASVPATLLLGPFLIAPLSWLEVQAGRWRDRYLLWMCLAPLLLVVLYELQVFYVALVIQSGSAGRALEGLLALAARELPVLLLVGVLAGVPLAMAGYRRVTHGSVTSGLGFWLLVSLVTFGALLPVALFYGVVELLHELSDRLERRGLGEGEAALPEGLPPSRVWLLAYLGHPLATRFLGSGAPATPIDLREWARGLEPAGDGALRQAVLAPLRRLLLEEPPAAGWEAAHQALLDWVQAPCPARAEAAVREVDLARRPLDGREERLRGLVAVLRPEPWGRSASLAAALTALPDPEQVRAEVSAELSDWALTTGTVVEPAEPSEPVPEAVPDASSVASQLRTSETDARP